MALSKTLLALGAALAIGAVYSTGAPAADKEQVIKDRQALMKDQGKQWLALKSYVQGQGDQAAASAAVEALTKSVPTVPNFFPPGTEGPNPEGTYAPKPEVWSERDKFLAADKKVADQVAALGVALKSGDKAKVEVAFKELDICSGCHTTFRATLK